MKITSVYLEKKGMTINEFKNKIIYELKNRGVYGMKTHAYKFCITINGVHINYRNLENKTINEIVDFYIDDIRGGATNV